MPIRVPFAAIRVEFPAVAERANVPTKVRPRSPTRYNSPEETPARILINDVERFGEGGGFGMGTVSVPLQVGPLPVELPSLSVGYPLDPRDVLMDDLVRTGEGGAGEEKLDVESLEALAFADLVAQMQRRPSTRPEKLLNQSGVFGDFGFGETMTESAACDAGVNSRFLHPPHAIKPPRKW